MKHENLVQEALTHIEEFAPPYTHTHTWDQIAPETEHTEADPKEPFAGISAIAVGDLFQ
ncbi:hypothetical protein DPMN_070652 [Dreissena polymorpha]|uniref:Uncharacterized protein n=1 Tax=Dreissena polymorpha TaxID=45954 RepID=A0A9D4BVT9_DREPO|nr:hypothetical protein DPMN_070652 [Dreissena polymorpha]